MQPKPQPGQRDTLCPYLAAACIYAELSRKREHRRPVLRFTGGVWKTGESM